MKNYKTELKWALIFSIATILWMVLEKSLGWHDQHIAKHAIYTNLFAVVAIVIYVLALRNKRDQDFGGKMDWKQGFVSGIIISAIIAIISPLVQYITHEFITPDYFKNVIELAVSNGKMTPEGASAYFNLTSYILQASLGGLGMGIVTAAIVAYFVKKQ